MVKSESLSRAWRGEAEREVLRLVNAKWIDAAGLVVDVAARTGISAHTIQRSIIRLAARSVLDATKSESGRFIQQIRRSTAEAPAVKTDLRALVDMQGDYVLGKGEIVLHLSKAEASAIMKFWSTHLREA